MNVVLSLVMFDVILILFQISASVWPESPLMPPTGSVGFKQLLLLIEISDF